jgi:hypothetical protein
MSLITKIAILLVCACYLAACAVSAPGRDQIEAQHHLAFSALKHRFDKEKGEVRFNGVYLLLPHPEPIQPYQKLKGRLRFTLGTLELTTNDETFSRTVPYELVRRGEEIWLSDAHLFRGAHIFRAATTERPYIVLELGPNDESKETLYVVTPRSEIRSEIAVLLGLVFEHPKEFLSESWFR